MASFNEHYPQQPNKRNNYLVLSSLFINHFLGSSSIHHTVTEHKTDNILKLAISYRARGGNPDEFPKIINVFEKLVKGDLIPFLVYFNCDYPIPKAIVKRWEGVRFDDLTYNEWQPIKETIENIIFTLQMWECGLPNFEDLRDIRFRDKTWDIMLDKDKVRWIEANERCPIDEYKLRWVEENKSMFDEETLRWIEKANKRNKNG